MDDTTEDKVQEKMQENYKRVEWKNLPDWEKLQEQKRFKKEIIASRVEINREDIDHRTEAHKEIEDRFLDQIVQEIHEQVGTKALINDLETPQYQVTVFYKHNGFFIKAHGNLRCSADELTVLENGVSNLVESEVSATVDSCPSELIPDDEGVVITLDLDGFSARFLKYVEAEIPENFYNEKYTDPSLLSE